jgi:peptide/nickel transport system permease protein
MTKYIARRILQMIPTLFIIYTITFALTYLMPGDPLRASLGEEYNRLDPATIAAIEEELGLNRPFLVQYTDFLFDMLRLDLGKSYIQKENVVDIIGYRLPRTMQLMVGGMIVSLALGIPAGIISAVKQYSWIDHIVVFLALIGLSMPVFWQGLIAQLLLTQSKTGVAIFPVAGYGNGQIIYMVLPSLVLGTSLAAVISRITRASMLEVRGQDYLKTAMAKGLRNRTILFTHQMRNALIPVLTVVGLQVAGLMTGALLTETIFNWPGLGRAIVPAIQTRDTPVIMGILIYGALIILIANLITDLLYAFVDPRIRYS